jgi:NAD(P)-dependent dehydrogenase (short-subunit alcohol dehydrogenase family)
LQRQYKRARDTGKLSHMLDDAVAAPMRSAMMVRGKENSMFRLDGRTALITGAATGIGQAIALALASNGADVVITDRRLDALDETESLALGQGGRVFKTAVDVREQDQIRRCITDVENSFGLIDILVNNAGINRPAAAQDVTLEEWDDHFNTNVRGGFFLAQAVAKGMRARGWGRIIFISSQSGLVGIPGQPVYCATKGAVIQLVRTLGLEWAKDGVTVNSIAPTFVETNLTRKRLSDPAFRSFVLGKIPGGVLAEPEQIGAAAVYLASEEAAMVNCETHRVDGGWTAW